MNIHSRYRMLPATFFVVIRFAVFHINTNFLYEKDWNILVCRKHSPLLSFFFWCASKQVFVNLLFFQVGQGPFAPSVSGLVKIGETMTMVVYAEGAATDFDIHVQECIAHDGNRQNSVRLTDERGCVLKTKLLGAFQKTRQTGNSGASIIAYSIFQAFKFPDEMEVYLECNVELCKGQCDECPEQGVSIHKLYFHVQ